jgi:benzylsuccinate CoA-transferase BbsE subunit
MESKGMAAMLSEPEYQDVTFRQQNFHQVQELVECFFLIQDSHDAYHEGQACGLPIGVMNAPEDLLADEHLAAREFFVPVEMGGEVGTVPYPGDSYRFSAFAGVPRKRAPRLGEHTVEVLHAGAPVSEST